MDWWWSGSVDSRNSQHSTFALYCATDVLLRRLRQPTQHRLDGCKDKPIVRGSLPEHGGDFLSGTVAVIRHLATTVLCDAT